jgi:Rieske Fe-S protein
VTHPISRLHLSRQEFLNLAGKALISLSGILGLAGIIKYLSFQPNPPEKTVFDLGLAEKLVVKKPVVIDEAAAALLPTPTGLKAVSLICPHLGCQVLLKEDDFTCPCHGSRFNLDGSLKKGPATSPLRTIRLEITPDNHLILDTTEEE